MSELSCLQEIERKIDEGRDRARKLKQQIADLQSRGRNAVGSMGYLRELQHSLHLMAAHRDEVARRLTRQQHFEPLPAQSLHVSNLN
jgi:tRNA A37 N6-isopentenylltransferase MiaA